MNLQQVTVWILLAIAVFTLFFLWGILDMPPLGNYRGPYGDAINLTVVAARHVTDAVTGVNFDYHGVDTLGEEFILFASITGVMVLLRKHDDEIEQQSEDMVDNRQVPDTSDATRVISLGMVALTAFFGIYIITHGTLTPGGGFQGGVILASAFLLVYIAGSWEQLHRFVWHEKVEVAEACGMAGFVLFGVLGLLFGGAFLQNVLPFGQAG